MWCCECKKQISTQYFSVGSGKLCCFFCLDSLPMCRVCGSEVWGKLDVSSNCERKIKYYRFDEIKEKMQHFGYEKLDVLFVGATGVGKSSTINRLTQQKKAVVGIGNDSETIQITDYYLHNNIRLWDTPGLGDVSHNDVNHADMITNKLLSRIYPDVRWGLIDMVVIVLDASIRDMGTVFELLIKNIIPNIQDDNRIIIGLNLADVADKALNFNHEKNEPNEKLNDYLENKKLSVKKRIKDATGKNLSVIYYSAKTGYNVTKLLDAIIDNIPNRKRDLGNHYILAPNQIRRARIFGYHEV